MSKPASASDGTQGNATHQPQLLHQVMISSTGSDLAAHRNLPSDAIGILFITTTGGRLFDDMSPKAPFLIVGAVNLLVMPGGVWLRTREGKDG